MKFFLTSSLLFLLVTLTLSIVTGGRPEKKKIKIIYDHGYYRSESRDSGEFSISISNDFLSITAGEDDRKREVKLWLSNNPAKPTVNDVSFVLESLSPYTGECEVAQVFKNFTTKCIGPIRLRELTDEEKLKAKERKQLLAASLEAKKRELNGPSDETGEFRVLVNNVNDSNGSSPLNHMIVETIGIRTVYIKKDYEWTNDTYIYMMGGEGSTNLLKQIEVTNRNGSFAVENILKANKEKTCEQSPLKDKMDYCIKAYLRPLTQEEKAQLDELKGSF